MLLSMTGFGKSTVEIPGRKITVEIKSLNSKQLDMNARVPGIYRDKEIELRNYVAPRLMRGKVDLTVSTASSGSDCTPRINVGVMNDYIKHIREAAATLGIPEPDDWHSLLFRLPDVFVSDAEESVTPAEIEALYQAMDDAADALVEFRMQEGAKLSEFFAERIAAISELLEQVPQYEQERVAKIRLRMEEQLAQIHSVEIDRARLEQEMIFYIEKLDVNEEKQRLSQHLSYFLATMEGEPGQGKKLGFIAQEMGREINTLGSKSNHADMQRLVVRMKDELEQIKEQVLNVL